LNGPEFRHRSLATTRRTLQVVRDEATFRVKAGLAEMLKGGVIMDVVTADQAAIAEAAGAAAVMALERVPADIRRDGGVARMSDPSVIKAIQEAVTIPVMAKARIGHFVEAQVLEALEVDYVDESEVLTPADEANHIDKWQFKVPFVCGATNLGEALRRIGEGAAMIRSKGEAGTGDIVEAVRHMRAINGAMRRLHGLDESELAGGAVLRRRHRDARGRGADDAARRRGCFRRLGDLQVRGSRGARPRDRRGDHALPRPGSHRGRVGGPRDRDDEHREREARRRAVARPARLVVVGVLALQGDFEAHARLLDALGEPSREVRTPADLEGVDALIIPGGESTTMTLGIEREGLADPLRELVLAGAPVLGTCAGLIMLDRDHLDLMDIVARRNAFGRQVRSFEAEVEMPGFDGDGGAVRGVFIRAPWISEHGEAVEILAAVDGHAIAARQGELLVVAFHPELAGETRLHRWLLSRLAARGEAQGVEG
jgi:pyridoxal 5'-phosphate synthase glutaminase subunit Pdx2